MSFGGEPPTVLATTPIVVAAPTANMNQLGTVYATKRRRRNGKRYLPREESDAKMIFLRKDKKKTIINLVCYGSY